jgi:hypothetical protein
MEGNIKETGRKNKNNGKWKVREYGKTCEK